MIPLWVLFAAGGLIVGAVTIALAACRLSGIISAMVEARKAQGSRLWLDD